MCYRICNKIFQISPNLLAAFNIAGENLGVIHKPQLEEAATNTQQSINISRHYFYTYHLSRLMDPLADPNHPPVVFPEEGFGADAFLTPLLVLAGAAAGLEAFLKRAWTFIFIV